MAASRRTARRVSSTARAGAESESSTSGSAHPITARARAGIDSLTQALAKARAAHDRRALAAERRRTAEEEAARVQRESGRARAQPVTPQHRDAFLRALRAGATFRQAAAAAMPHASTPAAAEMLLRRCMARCPEFKRAVAAARQKRGEA
jgi:hypothetical protein